MIKRLSLLILAFCTVTGAVAWAQLGGLFSKDVPVVDVAAIVLAAQPGEQVSGERPLQLVDVRSDAETAVSVIPGAITMAEYESNPERYADSRIVPYCTVGYRSRKYTEALLERGVDAANFEGSIIAWVEAGQPLVTLDGRATRRVHTWSKAIGVPPAYEQVYD
jgi:rhodanese-related sulfurtransferase